MTRMMAALIVMATMMAGCGGEQPQTTGSPAPSPSEASASESASGNGNGIAQKVDVTAVDFAFEGVPKTLKPGETTFVLTNEGEVSHEMTIGLLPPGWTIEEVAFESSESGTEIVGVIAPIDPGASGEVTMDLEPGRYGYICHETEGTKGKVHYRRGMIGEFKVK